VSLRLLKISISKFQDGGQPPFFKSTYDNNFIIVIIIIVVVGAKLQATNRVPRPVDRGTATRYGG